MTAMCGSWRGCTFRWVVGGSGPTLEDIIEFLVTEQLVESRTGWENVLEDSRAEFREKQLASLAAYLRCRVMIRAAATEAALDRLVGLVVDDLTMWPGLVLNKPPFGLSVVGPLASHNVNAYRPFARSGQCVNDAAADDVPHLTLAGFYGQQYRHVAGAE